MTPVRARLIAVWVIALLLVPIVFAAIDLRPNETPVGAPTDVEFDRGRLLDTGYYQQIDQWVMDHLPTRGVGRWVEASIDYGVLGEVPAGLVAGKDDWLFWAAYFEPYCTGAPFRLPETGDGVLVAGFAPKAIIHADALMTEPACRGAARHAYLSGVRSDRRWIDLDRPLLEERARHPEVDLFYRGDTHWTPAGRLIVAEALIDAIQPGLWDPDAVEAGPDWHAPQGLRRVLGFADTAVDPDVVITRGDVTFRTEGIDRTGVMSRGDSEATGEVIPGTTVLLGDSQTNYLLPLLRPYFAHLVFLHWRVAGSLEPEEIESMAPDRLVITSIEPELEARLAEPTTVEMMALFGAG